MLVIAIFQPVIVGREIAAHPAFGQHFHASL
jgi:hypothetical protein